MSDDRLPDLEGLAPNSVTRHWVTLASDSLGEPIRVPVIVVRGRRAKPTVGITSAVHGDELNGIRVIHDLVASLDPSTIDGTVVCVPVVNVPAFKRYERYVGPTDLNRVMPGDPYGNVGEIYAHRFINRIARHFDFLVDLHTASFGRVNSLYVRADLDDTTTRNMAELLGPEIMLHDPTDNATLRGAATALGIGAVTFEIGDPQVFQDDRVAHAVRGLRRVLAEYCGADPCDDGQSVDAPTVCRTSEWIYTDQGGLLHVTAELAVVLEPAEPLALLTDIFGEQRSTYRAPYRAIVIGKSTNPVAQSGARIAHLGRLDPTP